MTLAVNGSQLENNVTLYPPPCCPSLPFSNTPFLPFLHFSIIPSLPSLASLPPPPPHPSHTYLPNLLPYKCPLLPHHNPLSIFLPSSPFPSHHHLPPPSPHLTISSPSPSTILPLSYTSPSIPLYQPPILFSLSLPLTISITIIYSIPYHHSSLIHLMLHLQASPFTAPSPLSPLTPLSCHSSPLTSLSLSLLSPSPLSSLASSLFFSLTPSLPLCQHPPLYPPSPHSPLPSPPLTLFFFIPHIAVYLCSTHLHHYFYPSLLSYSCGGGGSCGRRRHLLLQRMAGDGACGGGQGARIEVRCVGRRQHHPHLAPGRPPHHLLVQAPRQR